MKHEEEIIERKSWIAAVMGMTMTGMGQIYNGGLLKGVSLFVVFIVTFVVGFRLSVYLPDKYFIVGITLSLGATLSVYIYSIVEAYRKSSKQGVGYKLKFYNKWYFYIAAWALCFFITGTANLYIRDNVFALYKIPVDYHQPVVLKGDRVIADKTAYKRKSPQKGDIIVFVYPDDRRKVFLRRIAGLPGDVLDLEGGQEYTVPHGTIFVLCESRKGSRCHDSRDFGPVPLRDVIGKVRQVIYSYGTDGMRWNRTGLTFGKSPRAEKHSS
ncbi:signal peptidase I [bacterium BMS3Abin07]|nr:signal peptidase I [bacterium BMS3Abin07]GBE32586.1 signal peptidase I [bacterium BMS3Bbin05]